MGERDRERKGEEEREKEKREIKDKEKGGQIKKRFLSLGLSSSGNFDSHILKTKSSQSNILFSACLIIFSTAGKCISHLQSSPRNNINANHTRSQIPLT